jgi:hypothetical protein
MEITQPLKNLYLVNFKKHSDLCYTFLRFQEYFESPKYKNKTFSLKEFKDWYCESRHQQKFTYCYDWAGFNIPDYILTPFFNNQFKKITKREQALLNAFKNIPKPFYIIGLSQKYFEHSKEHEIAHGLWYLNKNYKRRIQSILKQIPEKTLKRLHSELRKLGYHKDVFEDETHAFILSSYHIHLPYWGIKIHPDIYKNILKTYKQYNKDYKLVEL